MVALRFVAVDRQIHAPTRKIDKRIGIDIPGRGPQDLPTGVKFP
jgi:hypothetical protein